MRATWPSGCTAPARAARPTLSGRGSCASTGAARPTTASSGRRAAAQRVPLQHQEAMGRAALLTRREQALAHFAYGHEYQGNNGRLVVTPLTDRCYLAMGAALAACRVSNPLGPPGTGARARPRRERAFMAGHTLTGARPCRQDRDGEGARCARLAAQPLPQFVYTSPELIRAPSDPCPGSWQDFGKALARFVVVSHCTGGMGVEAVGRMLRPARGRACTTATACRRTSSASWRRRSRPSCRRARPFCGTPCARRAAVARPAAASCGALAGAEGAADAVRLPGARDQAGAHVRRLCHDVGRRGPGGQ